MQHPSCCILQWHYCFSCRHALNYWAVLCDVPHRHWHSISYFTVLVSLWGLKCFTVTCYMWVPKKKFSLYHWKSYWKNKKWLVRWEFLSHYHSKILSRVNLLFIKIQFMFCRCMDSYCYVAHPHTVLIKWNIKFHWCR